MGDQVICWGSAPRVDCVMRSTVSLLPSRLADSRRYFPGSGSLARMKAMRWPSGENAGLLSMSRTTAGGAAEHRSAIEVELVGTDGCGPAVVDVVAVGRERQREYMPGAGGMNLRVAAGRDVAQPETALAVVVLHVQEVTPVGRDGGQINLAAVGNLRDGEVLERQRSAASHERVDTESAAAANSARTIERVQPCRHDAGEQRRSRWNCCRAQRLWRRPE